jgi:hypothetical protein
MPVQGEDFQTPLDPNARWFENRIPIWSRQIYGKLHCLSTSFNS